MEERSPSEKALPQVTCPIMLSLSCKTFPQSVGAELISQQLAAGLSAQALELRGRALGVVAPLHL